MTDLEYRAALNRLHSARLVLDRDPAVSVECHPLIREHFASVMRSIALGEFRKGHSKLFDYYCQQAPIAPNTPAETKQLLYSVYHGCQAARHQDAYSIYQSRLVRGANFFLTRVLGAWGDNLGLLANFFDVPWSQPVDALEERDRSWVVGEAGYTLRALGLLTEALAPTEYAAEARKSRGQWALASRSYSHLSEIHLSLGHIQKAIDMADIALTRADQSGEIDRTVVAMGARGDALLQLGDVAQAEHSLEKADRIWTEKRPVEPSFHSVAAYNDLLIEQGKTGDVIKRATEALDWDTTRNYLLDMAFDHLALGRAHPPNSRESSLHLDKAVHLMWDSGFVEYLPLPLLARGTREDLDRVFKIASRSGMKLHLVDYHLAAARFGIEHQSFAEALGHARYAQALINETGYHRRDNAIRELWAVLQASN